MLLEIGDNGVIGTSPQIGVAGSIQRISITPIYYLFFVDSLLDDGLCGGRILGRDVADSDQVSQ